VKWLRILMCMIMLTDFCPSVQAMGLTVNDLVEDYNTKFGATWFSCVDTSRDFYKAIDQNLQKSNLQWIAIKTGKKNPITNRDGHDIVTYTEGRLRYVVSTWTDDNRNFYVKRKCVGVKTIHETCVMFEPHYKFIYTYAKGFGFIPKSRSLLMHEGGHKVERIDDVWSRTGKDEQRPHRGRGIWSA